MAFLNCGKLHKHYFMTLNDPGSYAGLMLTKSHLSEYKLFSGRLSRKSCPAFISEHYANEILKNLLMSPVKQSFLFVVCHNLKFHFQCTKIKAGFCATDWSGLRRYETATCCPALQSMYRRKSRNCEVSLSRHPLQMKNLYMYDIAYEFLELC